MSEIIRLSKGAEELVVDVAEEITTGAPKLPKTTAEIVNDTLQMTTAVMDQLRSAKEIIDGYKPLYKEYVAELRSLRMSAGGEVNAIRKDFEDLRKFFLSSDHAVEMARLKEFLELCDRLKALKESGFLDAVADTILKLST